MAELQVHGGAAVIQAVGDALRGLGLRLAEPGEFTRRAFEAGKLDLAQAEAIADLVAAESAAQRRQALRQLAGSLSVAIQGWRDELVQALARLEAYIDFPDEEIPAAIDAEVRSKILWLSGEISQHLDDGHRGERLREGVRIAILGPPNAGKSSLLNWLARREAAIVAATAGTTRDVIEVHLDLAGFPVLLADTAGLRDSVDAVEGEGIRRAHNWARAADLKVIVFEAGSEPDPAVLALIDANTVVLANKIDLQPAPACIGPHPVLPTSIKTGDGMSELLRRLTERVRDTVESSVPAILTRARHRQAVQDCLEALRRFGGAPSLDLAAEDLRLASRALGRITGTVDIEEILDRIFREFCIGK
jgi:tRNA modification GTPase